MIGLPYQNFETYKLGLEKVEQLKFGHSSFYMLTLEKNTPFYKKYSSNKFPLPKDDKIADMFEFTHQFLTEKGFNHYEVSNYARFKESQSKHNLMYWEGDQEFFGFGCGAASFLDGIRFS